jgi:hypothetical protein
LIILETRSSIQFSLYLQEVGNSGFPEFIPSQPERDRERRKAKEEDPCGERKKEKACDE